MEQSLNSIRYNKSYDLKVKLTLLWPRHTVKVIESGMNRYSSMSIKHSFFHGVQDNHNVKTVERTQTIEHGPLLHSFL